MLWRVESGGQVDHVFGTIHSEDPRVLDLGETTSEAFETADTYVMELIPDLGALAQIVRAMHFQDQRNLRSVLGEDLYQRTIEALSEHGIGKGLALKMKPWAVAVTLSFPRPESGMFLDMLFYSRAIQQQKKTVGLETVEEQLAFFQSLTHAEEIALLKATLANRHELEEATDSLIKAYLARQPERLEALSRTYLNELPGDLADRFRREAIVKRNVAMAERLGKQLQKGDVFAAIGALHLYGEKGVVNLLKQQGFEVSCVY